MIGLWLCFVLIIFFLLSISVYCVELSKLLNATIKKLELIAYILVRKEIENETEDIKDAEM